MPTFIDDKTLRDDFVPIRFHYADGRSSEGGRNVPVTKNFAGLGIAPDDVDVFVFDVYQLQEALLNAGLGARIDGIFDLSTEVSLGVFAERWDETFVVTGPSSGPSEGATSIEVHGGSKAGLDDATTRAVWAEVKETVRGLPARPMVGPVDFDTSALQAALKELRHSVTPLVTGEWSAGTRDALATVIPVGVGMCILDDDGINIMNGPYGQRKIRLHVYEGSAEILTRLKEAAPGAAISPAMIVAQNKPLPVATTTAPIVTQVNRSERFEPPSVAQPNRGAASNEAPPDSIDGLTVRVMLRAVGFYDKPLLRTVPDMDYVWDPETKAAWDRWATNRSLRYQLTEDRLRSQSDGSANGSWMVILPDSVFDQLGFEASAPELREKLTSAVDEAGLGEEWTRSLMQQFRPAAASSKSPSLWPWALVGGALLGVGYYATRK
jgi:hypothetical protein